MKKFILAINVWQLLLVIMVLSYLYLSLVVTPRYESHARVVIKNGSSNTATDTLGSFIPMTSDPARQDALWVRDYLLSTNFMDELNESLALTEHYANNADFAVWFGDFTSEDYYNTYLNTSKIEFDEYAGVLDIRSQAYSQDMALDIMLKQLSGSEQFINDMSHAIASREVRFATDQMLHHKKQLDQLTERMSQLQKASKFVDPQLEIASSQSAKSSLEARLRELEAKRETKVAYLNPEAFEVVVIDKEIETVNQQLTRLNDKALLAPTNTVNEINHRYQVLAGELEMASNAYKASMLALEQARVDKVKKLKHILHVQQPRVSLEPVYPSLFKSLFTVFFIAAMFLFALSFLKACIREGVES